MPSLQLTEILKNLSDNEELKKLIEQEAYLVPLVEKDKRAWEFFIDVCRKDERRVFGMSSKYNLLPMIAWMRKTFGDPPVITSIDIPQEKKQENPNQEESTQENKETIIVPEVPEINESSLKTNIADSQPQFSPTISKNSELTIQENKTYKLALPSDEGDKGLLTSKVEELESPVVPFDSKNDEKKQIKEQIVVEKIVVAPLKYKDEHFKEVEDLLSKFKLKDALDEVCTKHHFNREGFEKMYYRRWVNKLVKGSSLPKGEP